MRINEMFMEIDYLIGIAIIFVILFFLFLDRKNIEVKGIILLRKSKKLNSLIEKISKKYTNILNFIGLFSIFSVFISFGIFLYFSFQQLFQPPKIAPVQIVLPSLPGICKTDFVLCVPAYFWLLIIPIIAISHEFMHAFLARANNVKIKSVGYAFLLILPAFFVEIDEKKLRKLKLETKLKIYSAGSFGNFIVALFAFLLLILFSNIIYLNYYGIVVEVIENTPAYYANLSGIIIRINNVEIRDINDLFKISKGFAPNQTIKIETTEKTYNITLDENGKIGIKILGNAYLPKNKIAEKYKIFFIPILLILKNFFFWLFLLSLGIGMFNLLPLKPLDGGSFFYDLFREKFGKKGEIVYIALSFFTIFLIFLLILRYIFKF